MSTTTPQQIDTQIITEEGSSYPVATFTEAISGSPTLTKRYELVDGEVVKAAAGTLSSGKVSTEKEPLDHMIDMVCNKASSSHALIHGVCGHDKVCVTTKGNESDGVISRTKEHFSYGKNALFMFDHDPSERGQNFSFEDAEEYLVTIKEVCPSFVDVAFVVKPSTSAGIQVNGKPISSAGGFHAYCVARDGSDIPRVADILFKLLVINGYGYVFISKSGSTQVRTIFDKQVFQPERLDYIAPAIVGEGLTINQPTPQKFEGGYLDTSKISNLTAEQEAEYDAERSRLLDAAAEDAGVIREAYLGERSKDVGIPVEALREQYERGEQGVIDYGMPLTKNDGTRFSFAEAIADPAAYHGLSMRDPFEPEYGEDKAKLYLNKDGVVIVNSFCHGERRYHLQQNGEPVLLDGNRAMVDSLLVCGSMWSSHNRPLTDTGNAERFVDIVDGNCHFISGLERFIIYQYEHWEYGSSSVIKKFTKQVVRSIHQEADACSDDKYEKALRSWQHHSESKSARNNMLDLVKDELGIEFDLIDQNPNWIGCSNGTIDLKSQQLLSPDRGRFNLNRMNASYDPEAKCERFRQFIGEVTCSNTEVANYLQVLFGMVMLGTNPRQVMVMLVGSGSNGKSLLLETLQSVFGDYAVVAEPELFLVNRNSDSSRPRAEVVQLARKRLCITTEPPKGVGLNENLVKRITGNDSISARIPYAKEAVTFVPNLVPVMSSNHDVRIEGTDHGIWRRIRQIQFENTFESDKEKGLPEKLLAERNGILNWLLEGVALYQKSGLIEPKVISDNNKRYRTSQDVVSEWINECCIRGGGDTKQRYVYQSYSRWCRDNGYRRLVSRDLTSELKSRGHPVDRSRNGRPVVGIEIIPE